MQRTDLKVGIIGPGAMGAVHAETLARLGTPVAAVTGPKSDETADFATKHGVAETYETAEALLEHAGIDAVIIATPSALHSLQTLQAIEAGKHVLCEVPVALSHAEAETVAKTAHQSGVVATVAHTLRYWQPHRELVQRLSGAPATHALVRSLMLRQTDFGWTGKKRDWTDDVLWHHGAHAVDAALWFLGADDVSVLGSCGSVWPGSGRQMDVSAVLQTQDLRLGNVSLSYHSRIAVSDFLVVTEEHSYEIRDGSLFDESGVVYDGGGIAQAQQDAVAAQDAEFLSAIVEGRAPRFTMDAALPTMRVLQLLASTIDDPNDGR